MSPTRLFSLLIVFSLLFSTQRVNAQSEQPINIISDQEFRDLRTTAGKLDRALAAHYPEWANYTQMVPSSTQPVKLGKIMVAVSLDEEANLQINAAVTLVTLGDSLDWQLPSNTDLYLKSQEISTELNRLSLDWDNPYNESLRSQYPEVANSGTYALYAFFNYKLDRLQTWQQTYRRLFGEEVPQANSADIGTLEATDLEPFLALPFEHPETKFWTVNSFFDHQSPLYSQETSVDTLYRFDGKLIEKDVEHGIYVSRDECSQTLTGATCYSGHDGIDYDLNLGEPVLAAAAGTVITADKINGTVIIQHANGLVTTYLHMSAVYVDPDDPTKNTVNQGDVIGEAGDKGNATGVHLHFGVRRPDNAWKDIDPFGWWSLDPDPWSTYPTYGQTSTWLWKGDEAGDGYLTVDNRESQAQFFLPPSSNPPEPPQIGWHRLASGYRGEAWYSFMHKLTDDLHKYWAIWGTTIAQPGEYTVQAYWPSDPDSTDEWLPASNALYTLYYHEDGVLKKVFLYGNQTLGANQFNPLCKVQHPEGNCPDDQIARFTFGTGATSLILSNPAGYDVSQHQRILFFDAVQWQPYEARDLAFVVDDTGSMWNSIDIAKFSLNHLVDVYVAEGLNPKYHLITFKDFPDVHYVGSTSDPPTIKSWVNSLSAYGGDDCPEEMLGALQLTAQNAPHSEALVMTDAEFHGGSAEIAATDAELNAADVKVHIIKYPDPCGGSSASSMATSGQGNQAPIQKEPQAEPLAGAAALTSDASNAHAQIASETGGRYFQITTSETDAALQILLNEMVAASDLSYHTDEVVSASPKTYTVSIDSTATEANFLLNMFNGSANLTLINPNGVTVNPSDAGVTYTVVSNAKYYQIASPMVGTWQAQISGDGTFTFSTSGNSSISFDYLSDTSLAKNISVNLLASLTGPVASASFQFVQADGTLLQTVNLFDDGLHGDGLANDGTYGGAYTPPTEGSFYFRVQGTTTDNTQFERIATKTIRVQTLSVVAPADQSVVAGETHVYDFSIINKGTANETYDLAATSSQGWVNLSNVPASITVLAGTTNHIFITVNVPTTAVEGSVDELTLTVVSQGNALVHDSDSVQTTVLAPPTACVPSNSYGSSQGAFHFASFKQAPSAANFNHLPLSFVPNMGQEDTAVKFQVQSLGGKLFFTSSEVVFTLPYPIKVKDDDKEKIRYDLYPASVVRIHYQDANDNPVVAGIDQLPGVANYLKGNDPSQWRTDIPTYSGIAYQELYPGIELRYEGTDGQLKSTFYVAPGSNPASIVWTYKGADSVSVDSSGNLVITLPPPAKDIAGATITEHAPIAWQEANGTRVMVTVQYVVDKKDKKVSFLFPHGYDPTLPLVIDPTLSYSTYLAGSNTDEGYAITLDADCHIYVTGASHSSNFPTVNPYQTNRPDTDAFVTKLDPITNTILYSTYIGGSASDHAWAIGLDSQGRITVVGETESSDFPLMNAYDNLFGGGTCESSEPCDDVFVTQLASDGTALRYSTYLGGNQEDQPTAIALGPDDGIYLTGMTKSSTFPTVNGYDTSFGGGTCSGYPCEDVFVVKVDPVLSGLASLKYSTYLGGNNYDKGMGIALDTNGRVYIAGYTKSDSFPTLTPYQATRRGGGDIFITKLDTSLSGVASLLYSTYLGGTNNEHANALALGGADQVYLTGYTQSTNFPLANTFDNTFGGGTCGTAACYDAFVTHLNIANNTLVYSSYLGGSNEEQGQGITVDNNGNAYVTGYTKSIDFTTLLAIQNTKGTDACSTPPCADAFVTKVNASGNALVYSTYLGGTGDDYGSAIVVDNLGNTYITGYTFSSNFPSTPGSFPYVGSNGYSDVFVVKIGD